MRDINNANILVTGGAGFMGSDFIRHMLASKDFLGRIVNIDALTYCGNLENLQSVKKHPRYSFVKGNICTSDLVEDVLRNHQIDVIVHFAAESHVDRSIESSEVFYETNVLGTLKLLELLKKYDFIHFHHISTDEVYGKTSIDKPFTESSSYLPNSPYAASKASSDHMVRAFGKTYGISTCISHAVNNYGPYQFPEKLIPLTISRLLEKKDIPIYGKGDQVRDWLFVEDHSKGVEHALRHSLSGSVYNFSAKQRVENLQLVKLLIDLFCEQKALNSKDYLSLIKHVKDRLGHDFCYAVDPSKAEHDLKWSAKTSLKEGLKKTLLWYLKNDLWLSHIKSGEYKGWFEKHYTAVGV